MAGANPERTSWTPEEVKGNLNPIWYKPFEPYISQRVQIVAVNDVLYIATSKGLYALDAAIGAELWVYPTEQPLGHSPTISNGVAYVGGLDHKLHAVNAQTGQGLWTYTAGAGFQTNPLVVNGIVYAGNRDGAFYAIYAEGANAGQLAWKYQTDGPILYSAAYKDGVVFFASNDSHAYALDALTGQLVWKSPKLPGAGFSSWWPVVYQDRVIFSGSNNYRLGGLPGPGAMASVELEDIYPNREQQPKGTLVGALGTAPGDWAAGTVTVDASAILNYFAQKPWRRTVFVLDRFTGQDRETAPVLWTGNDGSVTRYPPVVGVDGVLYQQNNYMSDPSIAGGQITGWQPGNASISIMSSDWGAIDEPHAAAAGGNLIYWNLCCDRQAGAIDITVPNTIFAERYNQGERPPTGPPEPNSNREWKYFGYNLPELIPGYNARYYNPQDNYESPYANFGGPNGVYGFHSDVNPPIPYKGRVYMHRSNAIIAFGNSSGAPVQLPLALVKPAGETSGPGLGIDALQARLQEEVQNMLDAGHLRPGYVSHGHFDLRGRSQCGDDLVDYWHQPAETIYTLLMALPHLPAAMQPAVKTYISNEFNAYPPYQINHVGWSGAPREVFDLPPEVAADLVNYPPEQNAHGYIWKVNPFNFYALWKYAAVFGNASAIFEASKDQLEATPPDTVLLQNPQIHNAFIAGYLGYQELAKLAGQPASSVSTELTRLLSLRATHFTKDSAYGAAEDIPEVYCRTLSVADNFMYMVPELAEYLQQNALSKVQSAVDEYNRVAPYWYVTLASEGYAENPRTVLYDAHGLYMANAWILGASREQLEKYLDVPAFPTGDLYYIQKLVAAIEVQPTFTMKVTPSVVRIAQAGGSASAVLSLQAFNGFNSPVALDVASTSANLTANLSSESLSPGGQVILTVQDNHSGAPAGIWGNVTVTAAGGGVNQTVDVPVLVGGSQSFLPVVNYQNHWLILLFRAYRANKP
jgi:outer membrane protein assembly factor BamB